MSEPSFDMETIEGRLFDAAYRGDAESLGSQLDAHPERLGTRLAPYDWRSCMSPRTADTSRPWSSSSAAGST